jgi:hypothetical protein
MAESEGFKAADKTFRMCVMWLRSGKIPPKIPPSNEVPYDANNFSIMPFMLYAGLSELSHLSKMISAFPLEDVDDGRSNIRSQLLGSCRPPHMFPLAMNGTTLMHRHRPVLTPNPIKYIIGFDFILRVAPAYLPLCSFAFAAGPTTLSARSAKRDSSLS